MIFKNHIMGCNTMNLDQGSPEWLLSRAGVITASNAYLVIAEDKRAPYPDDVLIEKTDKRGVNRVNFGGKEFLGTAADCKSFVRDLLPSEMPMGKISYMNQLIGEVITGRVKESIPFKQAQWGHENEPLAREAFEAERMTIVTECGLMYKDKTLRCGASLDGWLQEEGEVLEIKCPATTEVHVDTILNGKIKPEYQVQYQFQMWVSGMNKANFCSFDPRVRGLSKNRLHIKQFDRSEEMIEKFELMMPKFIKSMDEALEVFGAVFGDQWSNK